jgi:hypothetical protein
MSFASGFFNSVDHDRLYDATDISRLFDGLIRDGIFASIGDCMVVKQSNQMNVTVGTGRAWFNHTWSYNDALYPVTIPLSEILMDRIDAIVLEINSVEAVRANSIKLIKGTPSSTPTKPALTNTKEVHQYPLAYVKVGKEVTSIRQADIENCVGTSVCPFVTGILEVISIEQLIPQWKDILNRFVEENTANFNTWMNGEKQNYQAWLTAAKKEITDWEATSKSDYQKWYDSIKNGYDQWFATIKAAYDANWSTFQQWEKSSQAEFDKWFENMKNKLEGDLGAKLTLETEKLGKEKVSLIESDKKDLTGTVEAPLMLGKATRNLLPYPYENKSGTVSHGVTMTYSKDGAITFSGTITDNKQPTFKLFDSVEKLFDTYWISKIYFKYTTTIPKTLRGLFQVFKRDTYAWVANTEELSKYDYDWSIYIVRCVVFYGGLTGDVHGTVSNIRIVTNADDPFVPYSGYDIKTIGKNVLNPTLDTTTRNGITCTNNGDGTYTLNGTATKTFDLATTSVGKDPLSDILIAGQTYRLVGNSKKSNIKVNLAQWGSDWSVISNSYDLGEGVNAKISPSASYIRVDFNIPDGAAYNNLVLKPMLTTDLNVTNDDFVPYTESTAHIDSSTEFPNFDLKTFDGATHIISPGNIQSFHADAPNGKYLLESIKKSAESGGVSYGVNAPTNPKAGDLWIDPSSGSLIQYWTGSKWTPTRALDIYGSDVVKSDSKPNAKRSTLWIDSGNGNAMKHVAEDGTVTELSSGGTSYGASAPSNTKLLWIDNSGVARFYNGSAWVPLAATWG